jgi:antitoxin StbD
MEAILADRSVGISELKANPTAVVDQARGQPVALLNRNKPIAYIVPAARWEKLLNMLDDIQLAQIVKERENEPRVKVASVPVKG